MPVGLAAAACAGGSAGSGEPSSSPMELPGIRITLEEETYPVMGMTVAEIGQSLRRMGPASRNRLVVGLHGFRMSWRIGYQRVEGGCRVGNVDVDLSSRIVMPRWTRPAGTEPEVHQAWDTYLQLVREHEDTHRSLALQAAVEIRRTVTGLEGTACTGELRERAGRLARQVYDSYRARNRDFDRRSYIPWPPGGPGPRS